MNTVERPAIRGFPVTIVSKINLNNSQAEKNWADAKKTAGVDTDPQNANIDYIIAQTSNEKAKKGLIYANTRLLDAQEELQRTTTDYTKQKTDEAHWNIKQIEKEVERLSKEINGLDLDNEFKKETLKNRITQTSLAIQQAIADIALKGSRKTKRSRSKSNSRKNTTNVG